MRRVCRSIRLGPVQYASVKSFIDPPSTLLVECGGYILTALALYTVLSMLLQLGSWRPFLVGRSDTSFLAPLMATLAMTTLLSSAPMLKQLDKSILSFFLN
jgi:hypothetical protein